jgi:hypothetical protein
MREREAIRQYVLAFRGFSSRPGLCHVLVSTNGSRPKALVGELLDNPGTSTTNAVEEVGAIISERLLKGSTEFDLYQFQPEGLPDLRPTFYAIEWMGGRPFRWPVWHIVLPQDDEWIAHAKRYLDAQNYTLERVRDGVEFIDATWPSGSFPTSRQSS